MKDSGNQQANDDDRLRSVKVWDLPTRLFHWILVVLVVASFVTANVDGNLMTYHMLIGYGILVLVLFRLAWGITGGRQSRFGSFVRSPGTVARYTTDFIKGNSRSYLGHNPLGGWSIIAMLLTLLTQIGTGLFANDDIFTEGPFYPLVSKDVSDCLTDIHLVNRFILVFLLAVHVFAVFYYLFAKHENLLKPMITGVKKWRGPVEASTGNLWLAIIYACMAAGVVYLLVG
jgi:cytochrome b